MRKTPMRLFVLFAFAVSLFTWGSCLAIESQEVAKIAEAEKDLFVAALMVEYLKVYGPPKDTLNLTIASLDELAPALKEAGVNKMPSSVILEAPFQVYTIDANMVMSAAGQDDLAASIVAIDEWLVPVRIHNESVALLTVGQIEGKWQVVGSSLGDFGKRINQVPPDFGPQKAGGKYVRVSSAHIDFIAAEDVGETKIFLFPYGEEQLQMDVNRKAPNGLYPAADVLPLVAQKVLARSDALD
jgi:hypothetical protein